MIIWIYCFKNNSKPPNKQAKKPLSDCMTHSLLDILQSSLQIFPQSNCYWQRSVLQLQLWWAWYLSAVKLVDRYREEDSQQSWIWMFSSSRNLRHLFPVLSCSCKTRGLFIRPLGLNSFYMFNCKTYSWSDWKQETQTPCSNIKVQSLFPILCFVQPLAENGMLA